MRKDLEMVCYACIGDAYLKRKIQRMGERCRCDFCDGSRKGIPLELLVSMVRDVFVGSLEIGDEFPVFHDVNDEKPSYERDGDSLDFWVTEAIGADSEDNGLVREIISGLVYGHKDDFFFQSDLSYVRKNSHKIEAEYEWGRFKVNAQHGQRFFNDEIRKFLANLFRGIDKLSGPGLYGGGVIRVITPESNFEIYRARRCDFRDEMERVISSPATELSAPPHSLAKAGRMNPMGVRAFYGALDIDTCIAELRPPVGGDVVSGKFLIVRPINLLDLTALELAYHAKPLSMFNPRSDSERARRFCLSTLHERISYPVLPNSEYEYLSTQVIAEFLANLNDPRIDGILFKSAQNSSGRNIVLLPHTMIDGSIPSHLTNVNPFEAPWVEFVSGSVRVHNIESASFKYTSRGDKRIDSELYDF